MQALARRLPLLEVETHSRPQVIVSLVAMTERPNAFARNVDSILSERRMSASELAEKAGLSVKTLNNVLNGRHAAQADTLEAIAGALGSPLWMFWLPEMPADLRGDETFPRLVETAAQLSPEARKQVARIADLELAAKDRI